MRYRDTGGFQSYTKNNTYTACQSANSTTSEMSNLRTGTYKTMTDVVVPDFRRRSERGEIFNNPMVITTHEEGWSGAGFRVRATNGCGTGIPYDFLGEVYGTDDKFGLFLSPDSMPYVANLKRLAGTQAKASIMEPDVYSLVEIAEAKSTMKLIKQPLDGAHKELSNLARSRAFRRYGGSLGAFISANWLKYRYAFTPLALSMQDAWKLATRDRSSQRRTARGFASGSDSASDQLSWAGGSYYSFVANRSATVEVSVRAGFLYEWEFKWLIQGGLTFREIPSAAFELVPYSFVSGWFANLGDLIRAITPAQGTRILTSWTTTKTVETSSSEYVYTFKPATGIVEIEHPDLVQDRTITVIERKPGVSIGPAYKTIGFDRPADWLHLADSLALLTQRMTP